VREAHFECLFYDRGHILKKLLIVSRDWRRRSDPCLGPEFGPCAKREDGDLELSTKSKITVTKQRVSCEGLLTWLPSLSRVVGTDIGSSGNRTVQ